MTELFQFDVRHRIAVIVHLLTCIEAPSECHFLIHADLNGTSTEADVAGAFARVLGPLLLSKFPACGGFGHCEIQNHEDESTGLRQGVAMRWATSIDGNERAGLFLVFTGGNFADGHPEDLLDMMWAHIGPFAYSARCSQIPARYNDELFETHSHTFAHSLPTWVQVLRGFEAIEELEVHGNVNLFLPQLLSSPHVFLFPRLRHVIARYTSFNGSDIDLLYTAILARSSRSSLQSPSKITIDACVVDDVRCRGKEILVEAGAM